MTRRLLCVFLMFSFCVVAFGAEKDEDTNAENINAAKQIKLPPKDTATYWVIRSQAMTEFLPFLTKKRSEFKGHLNNLTAYLDGIGKGEDYLASGIKVADTPETYAKALGLAEKIAESKITLPEKPLTWEQAVELAMKHVLYEGYMPTDVQGQAELDMLKKICEQKEKYGQKVRKELRQVVKISMNIWTYLGTINQQEGARVYSYRVKENARKEREARLQANRERSSALRRQKAEQTKRNEWQRRQNRLNYTYNSYRW